MPVDDANLQVIKDSLIAKLVENRKEHKKINNVLDNVLLIEMVEDRTDRTQKIKQINPSVGRLRTDTEEMEIYNKIVSDHAAL